MPEAVAELELGLGETGTAARLREGGDVRRLFELPPGRLIVVSDLHLGLGRDGDTFARAENFFCDEAFANLLAYCAAHPPPSRTIPRAPQVLVLNGDIFDFVRHNVAPDCRSPDTPDLVRWEADLQALGIQVSRADLQRSVTGVEKTYGLRTDPVKSVWKIGGIARGHPGFFAGLARWVEGGGWIVLQKGNHDLEIHWLTVGNAIRHWIIDAGASPSAAGRLLQSQDQAIVTRNLYLEHGHQYEPTTAVIGPSVLPGKLELNYPLGSFVNRYLINSLERISPFLDNTKPVDDAVLAILRDYPVRSLGILGGAHRFLLRAVRMGRWSSSIKFAGYFLLIVLPYATLAVIGLALGYHPFGDWLRDVLGNGRFPLGVVGVVGPYCVGALKELIADFGPGRKRGFAEDMLAAVDGAGHLPAVPAGSTTYLVAGHTHEQDSRRVEWDGRRPVHYVNSGTWDPLWPKDRPDLVGKTLHPVVLFRVDDSGAYEHEIWEWDDSRREPAPIVIFRPA